MSITLRDLIRAVRACKTAQEERDVVAKESAALRDAFKENDARVRHRNIAKLMYIHMLGYPTHFGQMETLKLISTTSFSEKRIGYLGLMLLLDERQEVLMLVTNSIKVDLNNTKNHYTVGLALSALGNIGSAEMCRDLAPDIERLMDSADPYVRKKATVAAVRVVRKVPDLIEQFAERAAEVIHDRNQAVMTAGITLMLAICEQDPSGPGYFRKAVPQLCKMLRGLLQSGQSPEHDVAGTCNPFLQVKLLRLLRHLGRGHPEASDQMSDVLAQVATHADASRNAGQAVLYEAVATIMGIESLGGLRVLGINILGRFLGQPDNNTRYVALNSLTKVVGVDTSAVQRHRATVLDCIRDADVSIRRRALELLYGLVNENNVAALTAELLDYLATADAEFRPVLAQRLGDVIRRFAPTKRWHVDNMLRVLVSAGAHVTGEALRSLLILITNTPKLQGYAARSLHRALVSNFDKAEVPLVLAAVWCAGEYGDLLVAGGSGALLEGEEAGGAVSDADVAALLERCLRLHPQDNTVREYVLTAAMKLTTRLPSQTTRLKALLGRHTTSALLECQTRACEYASIFKFDALRPQLLEAMPPKDEAEAAAAEGEAGGAQALTPTASDDLADLLGGSAPPGGGAAGLGNLLGGAQPAAAAAAAAADVLDLLGGVAPGPAAPATPTGAFAPIVAFQKGDVSVTFAFVKHAAQPAITTINATYANAGGSEITDFALQAAVPKFMQLKLEPASSSTLAPGGGSATQRLHVNNTLHGQKGLVMRLRVAYTQNGAPVLEQAEVTNFPAGL